MILARVIPKNVWTELLYNLFDKCMNITATCRMEAIYIKGKTVTLNVP